MGVSTLINLVEGRTGVELQGDYFIYYGLPFFNLDYQFLPLLQLGPARKTYLYSLHLVFSENVSPLDLFFFLCGFVLFVMENWQGFW